MRAKIDGLPFEQSLEQVIAKGHGDIFNALIGKSRPADISKHDWVQCVHALFSTLSTSDSAELVKISKEIPQTISIDTLGRVTETLVDGQILIWKVDHAVAAFRAARFRSAFANQLDSTFIKTMFKNLKISTPTKPAK